MSHPPIPKCKAFRTSKTTGCVYWFFNRCNGRYIEDADEHEMSVIASVAEVEWRKRAARWEEIADVVFTRFWGSDQNPGADYSADYALMDRYNARQLLLSRAASQCYDNAVAWRKWGAGK